MGDFQIPTERDFPHGQQERRARHLVRELSATRRRRRLVLTVVPALVILLTAATGFTAYSLLRTEPSHFESIGCYDRADLGANVAVVDSDGRGPIAVCRDVWRQGALGRPLPVHLAPCVLATGAIAVFPSTDTRTCERLGLADVSAKALSESHRFAALRNAIVAKIGAPPSGLSRGSSLCVGEAKARDIVRRELDAHGYSDWTIKTGGDPFSAQRPCADVSFDSGAKAVILVAGTR